MQISVSPEKNKKTTDKFWLMLDQKAYLRNQVIFLNKLLKLKIHLATKVSPTTANRLFQTPIISITRNIILNNQEARPPTNKKNRVHFLLIYRI